jgi:hypothetical protein
MPLGGPPPGLAQLPPMAPGAGLPPAPTDPVSQLSQQVMGLQQLQQSQDAAATGASMMLAQLLANEASPEAVAAQSSPSPGLPNVGAISGS